MGLTWWWRPFRQEDVAALTDLVKAEHVRPVIDRSNPLAHVAEALAYVEGGAVRGKVVITV
jgi:NADPH:quinone reductase-like Zn-dependent oxidoreductase